MGLISVVLAALAGFFVGALWYMTLAKPWMRAAGIDMTEDGKPAQSAGAMPFVISGICMLVVAGMMRHMLAMAGIEGATKSLVAGLGVGAFFIAPWVAMNYAYAMRSRALMVIDGGYAIAGCGAIGLVLGLF